MMISGLTIVRNGLKLNYPFLEAIKSILPICDEYIVVVGDSEDDTVEAVKSLKEPTIRLIDTVWSDKIVPRMGVLAQQTNIGLHLCQGDWVVCLQANEVVRESSLPTIRMMMKEHCQDLRVETLLFERVTPWGDNQHQIRVYPHRFKYSPRIIRPYIGTYSIRDAMSFAVFDRFSTRGRYPRALDTGEDLFRYGFLSTPEERTEKVKTAVHFQGCKQGVFSDAWTYRTFPKSFINRIRGSHPYIMKERLLNFRQPISLEDHRWRTKTTFSEKQRLLETWFYERFGVPWFRNTRYKLLGPYVKKQRP